VKNIIVNMDLVVTIALFVFGILISIIGYFSRTSISEMKENNKEMRKEFNENTQELGKLKGKIELVELESRSKLEKMQELTQVEIKNLTQNVGELTTTLNRFIESQIKK
jgi:predicted PurR-regulated permease PerM